METCIATLSVPGELRERISAIAKAGFDALELYEPDLLDSGVSPRDVGRMVRDHGLRIALLQPLRDFEGLPDPLRGSAFDRAKRKLDSMAELGTDLILVCASVASESRGDINCIIEDFRELGEVAAQRNIRVGFEALGWARHIRSHDSAWEVVSGCNLPNVGLIVDSFQTLAFKTDPKSIKRIPGERIFHVQLADAPAMDVDLISLSRRFRTLPGKGVLDLRAFMDAVLATNYAGPVSLEIFRDSHVPRPSAAECFRSLSSFMDFSANSELTTGRSQHIEK